jgi:hypothetical protein
MARDDENPAGEDPGKRASRKFAGEEEVDAWASPRQNLIAAGAIAVLSLTAVVLALDLPRPDNILTAAGLLPVLTGVSLLVMAAALGLIAIRDGALKGMPPTGGRVFRDILGNEERRRVLLLVGLVVLYIAVLDLVTFDLRFPTPFHTFRFGSFEAVSIPLIALILRIFWRAPLLHCSVVSILSVLSLAAVFRDGFKILLPGAD